MISRIELHNFMSHSCTVIEPAAGLTVLVGPNNCGKSAIVSALQILCENDRGDYMVRHGEDQCRIVVVTDDGHRIEWRRKKSAVSYNIDGEDVHRLQGDTPDDLHKILRLPKVETPDGHEFDVHFSVQKAPIFLLDEPGSRAATFFASSSDASRLVAMQGLHRQKGTQARREESRLTDLVEELSGKLEVLEPVTQLQQTVGQAAESYVVLVDLCSRIEAVGKNQDAIAQAMAAAAKLRAEAAALRMLAIPPRLAEGAPLEETISLAERIAASIATDTARIRAFAALAEPPDFADPAPIEELIDGLQCWSLRRDADAARHRAAGSLLPPPQLVDVAPLEALTARMDECQAEYNAICARQKCLVSLASPPLRSGDERLLQELIGDLEDARTAADRLRQLCTAAGSVPTPPVSTDPAALQELVAQMDDIESRLAGPLRNELAKADEALAGTIKEIHEWAHENPACPTCGVQLDPERLERFVVSGTRNHQHG